MTSTATGTDRIVEELDSIDGVMRDDIHVNDNDVVTTYVPTDRLEDAQELDGIEVEVLEDHEYEYLISAKPEQQLVLQFQLFFEESDGVDECCVRESDLVEYLVYQLLAFRGLTGRTSLGVLEMCHGGAAG